MKTSTYNPFNIIYAMQKQKRALLGEFNSCNPELGSDNSAMRFGEKNHNGRAFYTQRKMSAFRLHESILNSRRNRRVEDIDIHAWHASYIDI